MSPETRASKSSPGSGANTAVTESGFDAHLIGVSLIDSLQLLHFSRRTAVVYVEGEHVGRIHFEDGEIVHAALGVASGVVVLPDLLRMTGGTLRIESAT